jgi:hypothetical protein
VNRHALREVTRQLQESGGRGVIAVALVAVAAAWAGALLIARAHVERQLLQRDQAAVVVASLEPGAAVIGVVEALRTSFPAARLRLREPAATRAELANWFPELTGFLERLEEANFPTLLEIEVEPVQATVVVSFLRGRPEVALAESSLAWQGDLERTLRRVTVAGLGIAFALLLACGAVVLLAVRLLVLEHADEITIVVDRGATATSACSTCCPCSVSPGVRSASRRSPAPRNCSVSAAPCSPHRCSPRSWESAPPSARPVPRSVSRRCRENPDAVPPPRPESTGVTRRDGAWRIGLLEPTST